MPARTARRLVLLGALTLVAVAVHCAPALAVAPCATASVACIVTPPTSVATWSTVPGEQDGLEGLSVDLSLFQDGWPSSVGTFYATNSSTQPSTFAAFVGCTDVPRRVAAVASAGDAVKHRVKTLRVRPRTRLTASSSCRRGERLLRGGAAVVFDSRPTRAELLDHDYRYTVDARGVGDDDHVTLQVHAVAVLVTA